MNPNNKKDKISLEYIRRNDEHSKPSDSLADISFQRSWWNNKSQKRESSIVAGPADKNGQCLAVMKQKKEEEAQFLFVPID